MRFCSTRLFQPVLVYSTPFPPRLLFSYTHRGISWIPYCYAFALSLEVSVYCS